jgi:WD40 repeat protein
MRRNRGLSIKKLIRFAVALSILLALFLPGSARSASRALQFLKKIGVSQPDKVRWRWMGFVSFSADGTMVASDGPVTPGDNSRDLTFRSFPEGRLIKSLPVQPAAISDDWKYYATSHSVGEMETGKVLISLPGEVDAICAFSPDSRYVAEALPFTEIHGSAIRVIELATGKQVSGFGRHNPFSIAISPDGETLASGHWDEVVLWNMFSGKQLAVLRGFGR